MWLRYLDGVTVPVNEDKVDETGILFVLISGHGHLSLSLYKQYRLVESKPVVVRSYLQLVQLIRCFCTKQKTNIHVLRKDKSNYHE